MLFCICMAASLAACGETGNGQTSGNAAKIAGWIQERMGGDLPAVYMTTNLKI